MNIILQIDGGIGKCIAATAVCKAIKRQYANDQLIVISGYPEVFQCNPNVDKALAQGDLRYFFQEYIEGKTFKMCAHNPYVETDFVALNGHLIKVWCEMFDIAYNGEQPELYITPGESDEYSKLFASNKPVLVIQTNGGAPIAPNSYAWTRDLPTATAQIVVNAFASEYNIAHIRRQDQRPLQNTIPVQMPFRQLAVLIALSAKRLLIDSFAQHAAAALGKPSVVCWIANIPSQFGYEMHTNIIANPPTVKPELKFSVFSKHHIDGPPIEFCYRSEDEIFDPYVLIEAIKKEPAKSTPTPIIKNSKDKNQKP